MKSSSFHRVVRIMLLAFAVIGLPFCGVNVWAEDDKVEPPAAQEPPAQDKARPDVPDPDGEPATKKEEEKPEKEGERPAKAEVGLDELVAPLQELFGIGARPRGRPASNIPQPAAQADEAQDDNAPVDIDNNPTALQFMQMHQGKLKTELRFIRLVCSDMAADQRPKVRKAAENGLKRFALKLAKRQNQMQQGVFVGNQMNQEPMPLVRAAIVAAMKDALSAEQVARYEEESKKRVEGRKRAVILNVISGIDGRLFLDQEQRDKIEQSISGRWQEEWDKWSMYSQFGGQYLPPVPDECVVHCLNPDQKKVWGGIQRVEFGWWNNDNNQQQDDDQWWGVDLNGDQQKPAGAAGDGLLIFPG